MRCLLLLLFLPLCHSSLMEGDIITDPGLRSQDSLGQSAALANPQRLWPGGRVYYIFDEAFSEKNRKVVTSAMDYMSVTNPCLAFEDIGLTGNQRTDYVKIFNGLTCSSQLGRVGGEQQLSLNSGCLHGIRTAVHELCHTIGFLHEHTRPDRNDWVAIVEANIMEGKEANFKKQDEAFSEGFSSQYDAEMSLDPKDTPYDVESVLHYGPMDFSKTGQPVIKFLHEDEGRWPVAPPEDPLTTRVEIALTYSDEAGCVVNSTDMVKYVHINRMVNRLWIDNNSKKIDNLETKGEAKQAEIESMKNVSEVLKYEIDKKNSEAKLADIDEVLQAINAEITNVKYSKVSHQNEIGNIKAKQTELDSIQKIIEAKHEDLQRIIEAQQTKIEAQQGEIDLLKQLVERPTACLNPNILDSKTRHVSTPKGLSTTAPCGSDSYCCDNVDPRYSNMVHPDWRGEGWYRFTGDAGTKMLESPPGRYKCGTNHAGYLTGGHPTGQYQEVERVVHFDGGSGKSSYTKTIKVVNCGTFYVYHLVNLGCTRAFCGQ